MSGFLHHLARRTLAIEPQIHSRARLPYAEFPVGLGPASPVAVSDSALRSLPSPVGVYDEGGDQETAPARPRTSVPALLPGRTRASDRPATLHHGTPDLEAAEGSTTDGLRVPDAARNFTPLLRTSPDLEQSFARGRDAVSHVTAIESCSLGKDRILPAESSPSPPSAALRPNRNRGLAAGRGLNRSAANRPAREASSREPLPDVHISIGRVEVIAATPPAPKRAPPRAHETMPLQKYLERRVRDKR